MGTEGLAAAVGRGPAAPGARGNHGPGPASHPPKHESCLDKLRGAPAPGPLRTHCYGHEHVSAAP